MTAPLICAGPLSPTELEGYREAREGSAWFQAKSRLLEAAGPDARDYLQSQLSQDISKLEEGEWISSLLLSPQGRLVAALRVARLGEDRFVLEVAEAAFEATLARLERFKIRTKVTFRPLDWAVLGLRGPSSPFAAPGGSRGGQVSQAWGCLVLASEWRGVRGGELWCPAGSPDGSALGVKIANAVVEVLRVESGVAEIGRELEVDGTIPAAAGLVEGYVSFTKGCYVGQELVARLDARGSRVPERLVGVVFRQGAPERAPIEPFLYGGDAKPLARLTSVVLSPALGVWCGLGYLRREAGEDAVLASPEAGVAEVRELPLVGESPLSQTETGS